VAAVSTTRAAAYAEGSPHNVCDALEKRLEKIHRAITVMKDVDSSKAARELAVQVLEGLEGESKGNLSLLRTIREQSTRLQEEIDTLTNA
jgi:hypothetical protein